MVNKYQYLDVKRINNQKKYQSKKKNIIRQNMETQRLNVFRVQR